MERKIPQWKQDLVKTLAGSISKCRTMAVLDMRNLPAKQLGSIRSKLRGKATIKMSKKSIISRALKEANKAGAEGLAEHVTGMPALIFSDLNPFELFAIIKQNRSSAAAKAGQIAPKDIIVPAGPTPFAPGPIISQLGALGIKGAIENGKVVIKSDTTVLKKGESVPAPMTAILASLGIEPMEIGLNLIAALEDGQVYLSNLLDVDVGQFIASIQSAHSDAFKLSIERGILNSDTITFIITKAELDAKKLAIGADILTPDTAGAVLVRAEAQANALRASFPASSESNNVQEAKDNAAEAKEGNSQEGE